MLLINDKSLVEKAKMIIEKGTDKAKFLDKKVSKYTWKTLGSSYGMSQLNAAFLYAQLIDGQIITAKRVLLLNMYRSKLESVCMKNNIDMFEAPSYNASNGHMFYIKVKDKIERRELIKYLEDKKISVLSHYEPLHNSDAGKKYGEFSGIDLVTTQDASRILRLPLHTKLTEKAIIYISDSIKEFYNEKK
jgi:dTDP-4-amino-4,6-dideoxygalactose transaminase